MVQKLKRKRKIMYITTPEELESAFKNLSSAVIICYSDWCPASLVSKMYFENLAETYHTKCYFVKVIVDEFPQLGNILRIRAIPTFFFVKHGEVIGRVSGSLPYRKLKELTLELTETDVK